MVGAITVAKAVSAADDLARNPGYADAMRLQRFGELDVRITGGTDGNGGGNGPIVVLLHGFGAPGNDLVPLARHLTLSPSVRFAFPVAPVALPAFWGESRAWWMLDTARLERLIASGQKVDLSNESPPGMNEARAKLVVTLEALRAELGTAETPMVLGGFSQGAMLSCDTVFRTDIGLHGLVLLSGTLLCADEWRTAARRRAELPVFQSHGHSDPVLSFDAAERLRALLGECGLSVSWHPFGGAHEIPPGVLTELETFLRAQLSI